MPITDDDRLRSLLAADSIAVVGCSSTPGKAAHDVPAYLQRHGYEIHPVNPYAEEILGRPAVDSLDDVIERAETAGDVTGLWLQLGITDDEALARAEAAGLATTQDRCTKVEHGRLL
ncbi:MAG: CoA-binding protein [Halobaculum sp.]